MREIVNASFDDLTESLLQSDHPVVLRDLVADWPMVKTAKLDAALALNSLLECYRGRPVSTFLGEASIEGRFFYNDDMTGFNFLQLDSRLDEVIAKLIEIASDDQPPALYVGSTNLDAWLPGFRDAQDLPLSGLNPIASLWLGNRSRIAPHFDLPQNIACCVVGRRRFTLFPPEQIKNLYVGPLDITPAGQPISLVDFSHIDTARFPRAGQALEASMSVELGPGDAILIPSMWWHQVEGLEPINVLVNYWWSRVPEMAASPNDALLHALLSIRHLPDDMRSAWKAFFDYYIFDAEPDSHSHIEDSALGRLGPLDNNRAKRMRAILLNQLKR